MNASMQVALYPERHIQASAATQDPLAWNGDLLAIGIYSESLNVKGKTLLVRAFMCPIQHLQTARFAISQYNHQYSMVLQRARQQQYRTQTCSS